MKVKITENGWKGQDVAYDCSKMVRQIGRGQDDDVIIARYSTNLDKCQK